MEGVGVEVGGGRLAGEGVPSMLAVWMRIWLLPFRVSCAVLCPSLLLLLLLLLGFILLLLVALVQVFWGPSRHLGSLTAANSVSFDFNVSYSSCWGYSLINTFKLKKIQLLFFQNAIQLQPHWGIIIVWWTRSPIFSSVLFFRLLVCSLDSMTHA